MLRTKFGEECSWEEDENTQRTTQRTLNDDGFLPIALGLLSDSDDLKMTQNYFENLCGKNEHNIRTLYLQ